MNKYFTKLLFIFLLFVIVQAKAADNTTVYGPNHAVQFKLFKKGSQLYFRITYNNIDVIQPSPLVLLVNQFSITDNVVVGAAKKSSVNESYDWYGVHSKVTNNYNESIISLFSKATKFSIAIRVFNDGATFRFIIPGKSSDKRIPDEATVFNIPKGSTIWYHDLNMHYESVHVKKEMTQLQKDEWVAPPGTIKLPQGIYAAITEADLKNYAGMALQANGANGLVIRLANNQPTSYPYRLRYSPEDTLRLLQPAVISGTITTPWRVVIIGKDLNAMVNNDMVHNLCPPPDKTLFPQGIKTSWIKPGRAVWKYLNGGGDGTVEVSKHFTDDAASLGFEHNILEGFWSRWTDDQIKDLVQYSKEKGVGIWVWKHSKSLRNKASRDSFFQCCHHLGIAGVKIDFFDSEAKEVIDLYEAILKETALYHLMVDFHGANKPTGMARTYPNEMVREAVKGMEASKLEDRATHETTIPFTRFLAGPAEYTVVHFGDRKKNTTWAHQIASAAILSGPLLTYAANPDSLPASSVAMIKSIPATWDETIVLPPSEIGELVAFARRKGDTWFVAIMNGTKEKEFTIPLSFLSSGTYKTSVINDVPDTAAAINVTDALYKKNDKLQLKLAPGGGYIARFTKEK